MERVQALIGYFDLDPTRTLDIILDVFSDNIVHHHHFFRDLMRASPWGRSAASRKHQDPVGLDQRQDASGDVDMSNGSHAEASTSKVAAEPDGALREESGDFICAQVLGFKFSIYQVSRHALLFRISLIWRAFSVSRSHGGGSSKAVSSGSCPHLGWCRQAL